jgi:hypothetical protein
MYKLVRIETEPTLSADLACPACGASLPSREGAFALKYFMLQPGRRSAPVHSVTNASH